MIRKIAFALALCAGFSGFAFAQVLGKIDYVEGAVEITRNGDILTRVQIGTKVENLDLIKTSADGLASIAFEKGSGLSGSVQIMPSTTAVIRKDQISLAPANEIQVMMGAVNVKVKRLAGITSSVQVRTPSAILGVRGTEFSVASFNGTSIVACKEGEVVCASSSGMSVSRLDLSKPGTSSVPGTMIEVLESGKLNEGSFPSGDFEKNWKEISGKWKDFNVELVVSDPVSFVDRYAAQWSLYSAKVESGLATLRANPVLKAWLRNAATETAPGGISSWVKEKPAVMKDLIAMRGDMVLSILTWYRIQELIPYIPESAKRSKLSNGQTLDSFIGQFNRSSKTVASAFALFTAAEKQYMLRNDGLSPFSEF
jgi:hypothetical protein